MTCPRLIEIALPIREISAESVRDKSLRHGHISTLHLWWARRPLAASRAVVFASLVPDPDHAACPPEFRDAVNRLLKTNVPKILKSYYNGKRQVPDNDPYKPYKNLPDTPRNRLLTFIAKWSPQKIAFDSGKPLEQGGKVTAPKPNELLDDRSLVKWETSDPENEQGRAVLEIARELVRVAHRASQIADGESSNVKRETSIENRQSKIENQKSEIINHKSEIPIVLDPFAGGGAIPLEATRLGAQAIANDYNPVAYLILRATCEFPQKYGRPQTAEHRPPTTAERAAKQHDTQLTMGSIENQKSKIENQLAHDVEYWAKWILERAKEKIGHLYPPGKDGKPVVGYLWARTAPCSNPTCRAEIPLLRSLLVCNKEGKRVALTMHLKGKQIEFGIAKNKAIRETAGTMIEKGRGAVKCPVCDQVTPVEDLRRAGLEGKMGERMTAVITDTPQGKDYRTVEETDLRAFEKAKLLAQAVERPNEYIVPEINAPNAPKDAGAHRSISIDLYGFKTFGSLFNERQLLLIQSLANEIHIWSEQRNDGDNEYRQALLSYFGLWIDRILLRSSTVAFWDVVGETIVQPFGRQAIPMVWDFIEANPFNEATGSASAQLNYIVGFIKHESFDSRTTAIVTYGDAANLKAASSSIDVVLTDPPYFDAIAYADLSDFFYVWLKRSIGNHFPEIFLTPQTPKSQEAVAHKHRHHGSKQQGIKHFQNKLTESFAEAKRVAKKDGVVGIMFAHQDTEAWTSLISAIFDAGLTITATYPIDTELTTQLKASISALSSSITVTCRPREMGAAASFRDVRREIEKVVTESVRRFFDVYGFRGADLIVACYGPAVGVFGKYERVERADGTPVTVAELLALVRESALRAIAGEFEGDHLSRLYFVWANLYGVGEQAWDDARLVVQIGGEAESAMEVAKNRGLFEVDGSSVRLALLADRAHKKHLGAERGDALIDQLHNAMRLWQAEDRAALVAYLWQHDLLEHAAFWKLAQALWEVLPRDIEDWKLISALLSERETFKTEAKKSQRQERLFDA
ncbi:DUF1156 domain-containing protein [Anaerolineae bacterium CFX7]|nr:DUF1156 domain-containing protein [Anaerolineae bacterium CFX7]